MKQIHDRSSRGTRCAGVAVLTAFLTCASATAQSVQIPAPPQDRPVVLINADLHPISSASIAWGYLLFESGRITAIGAGDPPALPAECEVIDAAGASIYPGLISVCTTVGLIETEAVVVTDDRTEFGSFRPEVQALTAVNPDSDLLPVTRAAGILTAGIFPQGGVIAGRPSVARLDGWTNESLTIDAAHGMFLNWPMTDPVSAPWMDRPAEEQMRRIAEDHAAIERFFDEAKAALGARDADATRPIDLRFEAMRPVLEGREPLFVSASSAGQIEAAVAFAKRRGLRLTIVGGNDAERVAPLLREADVPVIVMGTHRLPARRSDGYDAAFTLPARLHRAGIRVAIAAGDRPAHERNLPHHVATAVAHGLPRDEGLRSITLNAAKVLGIEATHGSLEVGKAATIIVTRGEALSGGVDGDPLEMTTQVEIAFIDGRRIDLSSRHTRLEEKYREKFRQLGIIDPR